MPLPRPAKPRGFSRRKAGIGPALDQWPIAGLGERWWPVRLLEGSLKKAPVLLCPVNICNKFATPSGVEVQFILPGLGSVGIIGELNAVLTDDGVIHRVLDTRAPLWHQ